MNINYRNPNKISQKPEKSLRTIVKFKWKYYNWKNNNHKTPCTTKEIKIDSIDHNIVTIVIIMIQKWLIQALFLNIFYHNAQHFWIVNNAIKKYILETLENIISKNAKQQNIKDVINVE